MRLAIMQPYFMPYLPYWQLINAVDVFIIYDDVNFIKNGWINRNYILLDNKKHIFTLPLVGASPFKLINEIQLANNKSLNNKLLRKLKSAYIKAPYFNVVYPLLEDIILYKCTYIIDLLIYQFNIIKNYLNIDTEIKISSSLDYDRNGKGVIRVLKLCELFNADTYINAIGGQKLYISKDFLVRNITLNFIDEANITYSQYKDPFVPDLSLIDVLMFNSPDTVKGYLDAYNLI